MNPASSKNLQLTKHAKERIRQRIGIDSVEVATSWIKEQLNRTKKTKKDTRNNSMRYINDLFEVVLDGDKVVTVISKESVVDYKSKISNLLTKEITKYRTQKNRELRKIEIEVAEHTLNHLKALNPKTKALISGKLTDAVSERTRVLDEIYAIDKVAGEYGVEAN